MARVAAVASPLETDALASAATGKSRLDNARARRPNDRASVARKSTYILRFRTYPASDAVSIARRHPRQSCGTLPRPRGAWSLEAASCSRALAAWTATLTRAFLPDDGAHFLSPTALGASLFDSRGVLAECGLLLLYAIFVLSRILSTSAGSAASFCNMGLRPAVKPQASSLMLTTDADGQVVFFLTSWSTSY